MAALSTKRVILFGVGGVGSWCAEALVRTGLRHLTIVDDDVVQPSNINRQLPATCETIGRLKVEVLRERLQSINPDAEIVALNKRYTQHSPINAQLSSFDIVIDAIDSVADKAELLLQATKAGCRVFSSMGAALRFDPTKVRVNELNRVSGDGLARALRQRFKKIGQWPSHSIRCVWAEEQPMAQSQLSMVKGSLMPVTATFGCTLAALVVQELREKG